MNSREQFLFRLLIIVLGITVVLIVLPYEEDGILRYLRALYYLRLLGTGGWSMSLYYDFFVTNGYTYYSHIGPIGALTGAYPYGSLGLGQVIGYNYFGSEETNFNANFWASDGFAAIGVVGWESRRSLCVACGMRSIVRAAGTQPSSLACGCADPGKPC
jgi:hypothetical protein